MKCMSILLSTIFAIILLAIGASLISKIIDYMETQKIITSFENFADNINSVCLQETGNIRSINFVVGNKIQAVYVTDDKNIAISNVLKNVEKKNEMIGNNICLKLLSEKYPRCFQIKCEVRMIPFNYSESGESSIWIKVSRLLGKGDSFNLKTRIEKVEDNLVNISYTYQ